MMINEKLTGKSGKVDVDDLIRKLYQRMQWQVPQQGSEQAWDKDGLGSGGLRIVVTVEAC